MNHNTTLNEKIKYYKILTDHLTEENKCLKQALEDMRITAYQNKILLKDYIENVTNKDKVVQRLQCTIETLSERIKSQEIYINKITRNETQNYQVSKYDDKPEKSPARFDSNNSFSFPKTSNSFNLIPNNKNEVKIKEFMKKQEFLLYKINEMKLDFKGIIEKYEELENILKKKKLNEINNTCMNENQMDFNIKKLSLFERYSEVNKFKDLLKNFKNNLILLIDSNNNIWELVKRDDLNNQNIMFDSDNLYNLLFNHDNNQNKNFQCDEVKTSSKYLEDINRGYNFYRKENSDNSSINTSIINISKNEFNLSILLK